MNEIAHPTEQEIEFLNLAYNRFLDIHHAVLSDQFWQKPSSERFLRIKELFSVYSEILKYPPVQWVIDANRRPNHSDVGRDMFKFVRHVLQHFPFFEQWDEVWIKKTLVNLYSSKPQFIDAFISRNEGNEPLKYRFWESEKKTMTYIAISFPKTYSQGAKIYLKDMLPEKDGVKFAAIFMWEVLKIQVEEIIEN